MGLINDVVVQSLFPSSSSYMPSVESLVDILKPTSTKKNDPNQALFDIQEIKNYTYNKAGKVTSSSSEQYQEYLQFPNKQIQKLANEIVDPGDSDDVKAQKIQDWVINNIEYKSDIENYAASEYWAKPSETLNKESGDCEDGAFLIHSLMLHAGISPERIRTYGGYVEAGTNAPLGGHGWTAYQRQSDDEWVVLDWCYYPDERDMDKKKTMLEDRHYIDSMFYVTATKTVDETNTWGIDIYV